MKYYTVLMTYWVYWWDAYKSGYNTTEVNFIDKTKAYEWIEENKLYCEGFDKNDRKAVGKYADYKPTFKVYESEMIINEETSEITFNKEKIEEI